MRITKSHVYHLSVLSMRISRFATLEHQALNNDLLNNKKTLTFEDVEVLFRFFRRNDYSAQLTDKVQTHYKCRIPK